MDCEPEASELIEGKDGDCRAEAEADGAAVRPVAGADQEDGDSKGCERRAGWAERTVDWTLEAERIEAVEEEEVEAEVEVEVVVVVISTPCDTTSGSSDSRSLHDMLGKRMDEASRNDDWRPEGSNHSYLLVLSTRRRKTQEMAGQLDHAHSVELHAGGEEQ